MLLPSALNQIFRWTILKKYVRDELHFGHVHDELGLWEYFSPKGIIVVDQRRNFKRFGCKVKHLKT